MYFVTYSRWINSRISNLSLKSNNRSIYSENSIELFSKKLNPWFVTGFADAESSFSMSVFKSKTAAIGWTVEPCFIITSLRLHKKDIEL